MRPAEFLGRGNRAGVVRTSADGDLQPRAATVALSCRRGALQPSPPRSFTLWVRVGVRSGLVAPPLDRGRFDARVPPQVLRRNCMCMHRLTLGVGVSRLARWPALGCSGVASPRMQRSVALSAPSHPPGAPPLHRSRFDARVPTQVLRRQKHVQRLYCLWREPPRCLLFASGELALVMSGGRANASTSFEGHRGGEAKGQSRRHARRRRRPKVSPHRRSVSAIGGRTSPFHGCGYIRGSLGL